MSARVPWRAWVGAFLLGLVVGYAFRDGECRAWTRIVAHRLKEIVP